ncbi:MAG: PKD domain-containing protein, partial [Flavobacteriales bacterium]|nr:PKD domain-containing protein [Flavobacteriales bacterium]
MFRTLFLALPIALCNPASGQSLCDSLNAFFQWNSSGAPTVDFQNWSDSPDPLTTSYLWNFGDGSFSTMKNPAHTFAPGTYAVCLTVQWANCSSSFCDSVTVGLDACAGLSAFFTSWSPQPLTVEFF